MESPTAAQLEATRVARFATMNARTDTFAAQSVLPNAGLVVRKVLGAGIVADPKARPSAILVEHPFSMTFVEIPPGQAAPLHAHATEEVFFIVEGRMTFFWGDKGEHQIEMERYDTVTMPKHVFRAFENRGSQTARMMVTVGGGPDEVRNSVTYAPDVVAAAQAAGVKLD